MRLTSASRRLKSDYNADFVLDSSLWRSLWELGGEGDFGWRRDLKTQEHAALARFNPGRCY